MVAATLIDFHVHTPISRCYSESGVQAATIVDAALTRGLDALVICDHHSAAAVDELRTRGGSRIVIFPGVEITTREGHLLAIFDPVTPTDRLFDLLETLEVPTTEQGNGSYVIGPSLLAAIEAVTACGGLAVPAHIDRWPNGFLEAPVDFRTRRLIQEHPAVAAVEITLPATKRHWERGTVRGYSRPIACVQGSDAHSPGEVGRRPTAVATENLTVAGLRRAFTRESGGSIEVATEFVPRAEIHDHR